MREQREQVDPPPRCGPKPKKRKAPKKGRQWFKWTVEIEVHETWVADGFDMTEDRLRHMLEMALPYALR